VWRARGPGLSGGSLLRACRPVEVDVDTQTDAFMEQLPAPIFIPMKTGVDVETQIYEVRARSWRGGRAQRARAHVCCRRARPPPCRRALRSREGGGGAGFVRGAAAAGCSRVCGRCAVRASGRLVRL
jgi:hypothetical protein